METRLRGSICQRNLSSESAELWIRCQAQESPYTVILHYTVTLTPTKIVFMLLETQLKIKERCKG